MKILDATCGTRTIWYQKNHPLVTYMDKRKEKIFNPNMKHHRRYSMTINPDVVSDWKNTPFETNEFDMVIFDPPNIIKDRGKKKSIMMAHYGVLYSDNWKSELKLGIKELFRVLKPSGIFILKWNECQKKVDEVLKLFPYQPLFGTKTGRPNKTHWIVFLKYDVNVKLNY